MAPPSQVVLEVIRTEWITPHLVRVVAGGPGFADFVNNDSSDRYAKLFFANPALGLTPPYDLPALRETLAQDDWPVVRTYTIRRVTEAELWVDFVVHGDTGVAGPWAAAATPGDVLVLAGPGGGYAPDPNADGHVLAGDMSAVPAISAALEAMPRDAVGLVFIEVDVDSDIHSLDAPQGVEITWVRTGELASAVDAAAWPSGDVQVFAHGEREAMKALREVFRAREVTRERLSLSGYWARGRTEDRFQAEKREPIGRIAD